MSNGHEPLDEILARLSKKPGVKATIALDRNSGTLLKTSGQVSSIRTARTNIATGLPSPSGASFSAEANDAPPRETQGVEELSALVWNFIKATDTLVEEIDTEDELKLLRLRTKKQELIIFPDSKFLFIAVHDTPPA